MRPTDFVAAAQADGVRIHLAADGLMKVTGDRDAVARWLPRVREHREDIVTALRASRWWRLTFPDMVVEASVAPDSTHADVLELHPGAVAAEPFTPTTRQPSAPMTGSEETVIRAWLAYIGEHDPETIAEVLSNCRSNPEDRAYFVRRATEVPPASAGQ